MVSVQFSWARVVAVFIVIYVFIIAIMSAVAFKNIRDNDANRNGCSGCSNKSGFYDFNQLNVRYWLNVVSAILLFIVVIAMWIGN